MARTKAVNSQPSNIPRKPALTPESDEQQMITLAMDLVRQRLIDGTASSQETTHFLKLASTKHKLEMERMREENKLITAKTEAIQSAKEVEKLYADAISAMRRYSGQGGSDEEDEYY